jgi:peptide/nickel transport system substrate-binding protein
MENSGMNPYRRTLASLVTAMVLGAGTLAWHADIHAQSKKSTAVLGIILEPTGLDPTIAPAASIGEVVHYNVFEGLTKINVDGTVTAGRWIRTANCLPSSCVKG